MRRVEVVLKEADSKVETDFIIYKRSAKRDYFLKTYHAGNNKFAAAIEYALKFKTKEEAENYITSFKTKNPGFRYKLYVNPLNKYMGWSWEISAADNTNHTSVYVTRKNIPLEGYSYYNNRFAETKEEAYKKSIDKINQQVKWAEDAVQRAIKDLEETKNEKLALEKFNVEEYFKVNNLKDKTDEQEMNELLLKKFTKDQELDALGIE